MVSAEGKYRNDVLIEVLSYHANHVTSKPDIYEMYLSYNKYCRIYVFITTW